MEHYNLICQCEGLSGVFESSLSLFTHFVSLEVATGTGSFLHEEENFIHPLKVLI